IGVYHIGGDCAIFEKSSGSPTFPLYLRAAGSGLLRASTPRIISTKRPIPARLPSTNQERAFPPATTPIRGPAKTPRAYPKKSRPKAVLGASDALAEASRESSP